ncbi:hypothetical protein [Pseudonocardia acidicola]|uniref:Pyridoxamine 5'-phosphate oxidase family protein n=1 Tax=Pseudonocardia acidicola TaxID=2724939 RepID=A0ABX1SE46_9PSEU|nr:hypothetical protein [Pseudonocardia acidicola]NMH98539.1 pyridoxamine 5'-phosphate oxidase family protein [Pseudonocardia acidicola]
MARLIGDRLPPELVEALGDDALAGEDQPAYLLSTCDDSGNPRISMLSVGELVVPDDRHLRVALWQDTHTGHNLRAGRPALFSSIAPGSVLYVRTDPAPLPAPPGSRLDFFELTVTAVESDEHIGMPVTSGITFTTAGADAGHDDIVATWRRQRGLLAAAPRS